MKLGLKIDKFYRDPNQREPIKIGNLIQIIRRQDFNTGKAYGL